MIDLDSIWNKINKYAQQYKEEYISLLREIFIPLKPKIVVELGTHAGGSFWGFCESSSDDTMLISVDYNHGGDSNRIRKFHVNAHTITGNTQSEDTLIKVKKIIEDNEIDFLFIDADHTYVGVKRDFQMWSPLVRDFGIIAFHDILYHPYNPDCNVDVFWGEIKDLWKSKSYYSKKDQTNYGIGVIQKNNNSDNFIFDGK